MEIISAIIITIITTIMSTLENVVRGWFSVFV